MSGTRTGSGRARFRLEIVSAASTAAFYEGSGKEPTTIGRARDNVFAIRDDKTVSRHHAVIESDADGFRIRDTQSLAGVKRGGKLLPTAGAKLEHGDEVLLGRTVLRFTLLGAESAPKSAGVRTSEE